MKVLAIILDGFEELEAVAPFALLRRANISLDIASYNKNVIGSHNITLSDVLDLREIDYKNYDCLIIPGGSHYKKILKDDYILNIIKYYLSNKKLTAGICAAPTIFGKLGYLNNVKYTCFECLNEDFSGFYQGYGVFKDNNIITATSAAYSIEFGYKIIEELLGIDELNKIKKSIYNL